MSFFDARNIADVLNGRWIIEPQSSLIVSGVGTDTRADLNGRMFVALRGPNHDGHDHLRRACAAGARLLLVERPPADARSDDVAVLQVDDTRAALRELAAAYRQSLTITTVIAVTGSCGKTTTKELIHSALSTALTGTCAPKSFNNDIGMPLTILAASPSDDYLVLEIGMNQPGEIASLGNIAQPDIAVITTVGTAHLGNLGSLRAIADEKASLLETLAPGALAVLNTDHDFADEHAARWLNTIRFGCRDDADLRLVDHGCDDIQQLWWFDVNDGSRFRLSLPGRHNAVNALAAVAIGRRLGVSDDAISTGLSRVTLPDMRMHSREIAGVRIVNDAYNANPQSMQASIEAFLDSSRDSNRRVLMLGDMLELGAEARALHEQLGRGLLELSESHAIDHVVLVGELMQFTHRVLAERWTARRLVHLSELNQGAIERLWDEWRPGDAVLLKASRGLSLERVVDLRPDVADEVRRAAVA